MDVKKTLSFRRRPESLNYEAYKDSGFRRNDKPAFYKVWHLGRHPKTNA